MDIQASLGYFAGWFDSLIATKPEVKTVYFLNNNTRWTMNLLVNYVFLPASISWILWHMYCKVTERIYVRKYFHQKVVLVTGASSGLGEGLLRNCPSNKFAVIRLCFRLAISRVLHQYGAKLILVSRDIDKLNELKKDLMLTNPLGFMPSCVRLDLERIDDIRKVVEGTIQVFGNIDVVINNAGLGYRGAILDTELFVHQRLMSVNFFGHVELIRGKLRAVFSSSDLIFLLAFLKHFIANNSGTFVGITSVQSQISLPYRSAYAASKHALLAFLDCLRAELSLFKGINVLAVNPGYIKTNASINSLVGNGNVYNRMDQTQAKGMNPMDVAENIAVAIAHQKKEIIIAQFHVKLAILIRTLFPRLFFLIMSKRAASQFKDYVN